MFTKNSRTFLILILAALITIGCKQEEKEKTIFDGLDTGSPEYAAVKFMHSIYSEQTIDTAIAYSSDSMARVIKSYKINRNIQKNLLNLKFDTVTIVPQSGGNFGRGAYSNTATITLFLSGYYDGKKIEDLREIYLENIKGKWKVSHIENDTFM